MSYQVDWHPIRSEADLPKRGVYLVTWLDKKVSEAECRRYELRSSRWFTDERSFAWDSEDAPIAWALMPEPWEGDKP